MTRRYDSDAAVEARISEIEDARVPTRTVENDLISADEARYEARVYGEPRDENSRRRPTEDVIDEAVLMEWDEERRMRRVMRGFFYGAAS